MIILKKEAAATLIIGPFVDGTDSITPEAGLTAGGVDTIGLYKPGETSLTDLAGTTTLTHRAGGMYSLTLSDEDTDTAGIARLHIRDDDVCLPVWESVIILPANIYDSLFSTDKLQVDVVQWLGQAVTAGAGNRPSVDAAALSGSTVAADKLEAGALSSVTGAVNDASATSSVFITGLAEATNDHYNNQIIKFVTGALSGQAREIADYDGGTKTVTVFPAFTEAPADTDQFIIV